MKKAFTLLETIVVLSLLSLLLAIVFPVFAQVRERSRQSVCASNLRQISLAVKMYCIDYDDYFPYSIDNYTRLHPENAIGAPWHDDIPSIPAFQDILQPYCHSHILFRCPSDTGVYQPDGTPTAAPSRYEALGMSYAFEEYIGLSGITEHSIGDTSRTPYVYDDGFDWHSHHNAPYFQLKGNVLYVDGHVKMHRAADHF